MILRTATLLTLLALCLCTSAVRAQVLEVCPNLYFLTADGKSLTLFVSPLALGNGTEIGTFSGRNPIRDFDVDVTTGTVYGLQGNQQGTRTRLLDISLEDASRDVVANFRGVNIMKIAISPTGTIYAQDSAGIIWILTSSGGATAIGVPDGLIASALAFINGQLLLLEERSAGRFFLWDISTSDATPTQIGKIRGLGGQRQGSQISFAMSMFRDPDFPDNIIITSFRQPFTRMFFTSPENVANGIPAEKLGRTTAVRLVTAGLVYCD